MYFVYGMFTIIAMLSIIFLVISIDEREPFLVALSILLIVAFGAVGISGSIWEEDKKYAREEFVSGTYEVDTQAVIKNCDDEADALAVSLIDEGTSKCIIEPNIGRRDLEFVCTISKEGEDIRVYLHKDDIETMLEKKYIKAVA